MGEKTLATLKTVKKELIPFAPSEFSKLIEQIDDALREEEEESINIEEIKAQGFQEGYKQRGTQISNIINETVFKMFPNARLQNQILQMPDQIKERSETVADMIFNIEDMRYKIEQKKNDHLQFVLEIKEEGKLKFSNDKARQVALDQLLRDDIDYNKLLDELIDNERVLRSEQIQFDHLHNLFDAYLAIAGMKG